MLRRGAVVARAVLAHRPAASWAAASGQRRSLAMMVSPDCLKVMGSKLAAEPHLDAMKLKTDDAEPVKFTYKQLNRQVDGFAKGLVGAQFTPGSKFVIWTKDIAEGVVAQLAALKVGCKVTILGAEATEADLAKAMVDARALLFSPTLKPNNETMTMVKKVIPAVEEVEEDGYRIVDSPEYPSLRWVMTTGFYGKKGMIKYQHIFSYDDPDPLPEVAAGSISYAGPGAPKEFKSTPIFDETVSFLPDEATFAEL